MKPTSFVAGIVLQSLVASWAHAQDATPVSETETVLPPVVVTSTPPTAKRTTPTPAASPKPLVDADVDSDADAAASDELGQGPALTATSILDSEQLTDWRVQRVESVVLAVPNANLSGFGDGRMTMVTFRGVGPLTDPFAPDDNTVIMYIDGVPQLVFASDASLFDLAGVVVRKGPQGTRSGWNTTGGSIDYVTRKPGDGAEREIRTEVGESGHVMTEAAASEALPDGTAAGRIAVRYSGIDGFVPNVATGNDVGQREIAAARGTVVSRPSPDTVITMSLRGEDDDRTFPYFLLRDASGFPIALQAIDATTQRKQIGGSVIVERSLENYRFTSLSGISSLKVDTLLDDTDGFLFSKVTGLPPAAFASDGTLTDWQEDQQLWSQEFRWAALKGSIIDWVAGFAFLHNRFEADYRNTHVLFTVSNGNRLNDLRTTSIGAFGEVTVPIAADTRLTGGIRANYDHKTYDSRYTGIGVPGTVGSFVEEGSFDFAYVTGRVSLSHDLSANSSVVGTVSRGEKSGGFPRLVVNAAVGTETAPYESTKIMAYEAGYRHSAASGAGTIYAGLFFNDVKDEQLFVFDAASFNFIPDNMDTQTYGAELEGDWRLAASLRLSAGIGLTVAEIKNVSAEQRGIGAKDGNKPPNTPGVTAFARLDYREKVPQVGLGPNAAIFSDLGWSYVGERAANVANDFFLNDFHMVDARVGLALSAACELYLFGRNLLDVTPEQFGTNVGVGVDTVTPDRGRVAGVGFAANW